MERISVFTNEVELEFDNGLESGYINLETNGCTEGVVNLELSVGDSGSEQAQDLVATLTKENMINFLQESLDLLQKGS